VVSGEAIHAAANDQGARAERQTAMSTTNGNPVSGSGNRVASSERQAEPVAMRCGACVGCGGDTEVLGVALVVALEQALLAAQHLLGALGNPAGCHATSATQRDRPGMPLALTSENAIVGGAAHAPVGAPVGDAEVPPPSCVSAGGLSRRESEVLALLALGHSNRDIAQALFLSPRTVQRHVANLYLKIGAHSRAEATAYAIDHGLR